MIKLAVGCLCAQPECTLYGWMVYLYMQSPGYRRGPTFTSMVPSPTRSFSWHLPTQLSALLSRLFSTALTLKGLTLKDHELLFSGLPSYITNHEVHTPNILQLSFLGALQFDSVRFINRNCVILGIRARQLIAILYVFGLLFLLVLGFLRFSLFPSFFCSILAFSPPLFNISFLLIRFSSNLDAVRAKKDRLRRKMAIITCEGFDDIVNDCWPLVQRSKRCAVIPSRQEQK